MYIKEQQARLSELVKDVNKRLQQKSNSFEIYVEHKANGKSILTSNGLLLNTDREGAYTADLIEFMLGFYQALSIT